MNKNSYLVLITGYSGFVGKNLIDYFSSLDWSILKVSLRDFDWVTKIVNCDAIIHLAGISQTSSKRINNNDYFSVNRDLTIKMFDHFLSSETKVFLYFSSVKAVTELLEGDLLETFKSNPSSVYGWSKYEAEQYILNQRLPVGKRFFILRPCMIHGPGNKGNLNLLFQLVSKGIPWPLGAFKNKRSFCSIDNLMFIIKELIEREDIPSGVYNIADDEALSTNEVISVLAESQMRTPKIWDVSKGLIQLIAKIGNLFPLPLNEERLQKLTDSYVVSNLKIKSVIGKPLPISSKEGLLKTFKSFS
jgi:nucleoside-diphosphate-sugar epimerase